MLCRVCIDGFGDSVISIGFACANCTENNYGWVLYIISEFVPATVFYFAILTLLPVTFVYILPSSRSETLPLVIVITSSVPQLVLLFTVYYRQLKGKHRMRFIASKVNILIHQVCAQKRAEVKISVADSLPHRLISPNQ